MSDKEKQPSEPKTYWGHDEDIAREIESRAPQNVDAIFVMPASAEGSESNEDAFKRWRITMETLAVELETKLLAAVDDKGLTINCHNATRHLLSNLIGAYKAAELAIGEGVQGEIK